MVSLLSSVEIQTIFNQDKRVFKGSLYESLDNAFDALQAFVVDSYNVLSTDDNDDNNNTVIQVLIQYKDEEDDMMTLTTVDDFKEALEFAREEQSSILLLYITVHKSKEEQNKSMNEESKEDTIDTDGKDGENTDDKEFGNNLFYDLCNYSEFKAEFISFLKTLLVLLQETSFDPSFEVETCVLQALSSHDILMDYPLFKKYFQLLKLPKLTNQIKFFSTFLLSIEPSQIEVWVNQAIERYHNNNNGNNKNNNNNQSNGNGFGCDNGASMNGPFGNGFGANGNGGNAAMPFFMQYLTSLLQNSDVNGSNACNQGSQSSQNNGKKSENVSSSNDNGVTKGGNNNKDEPLISSTIGTKYENNNGNNNGGNNNNDDSKQDNSSSSVNNEDTWKMPPPPPPFGFDLINLITGAQGQGQGAQCGQGQGMGFGHGAHGHNHHGHNHHGHGHGHGHHGAFGPFGGPWRGRGRGRGRPYRGRDGGFGHFAHLLNTLAGANANANGNGMSYNVPFEASGSQNGSNNNNGNGNESGDNGSIDCEIVKDDISLADNATVLSNQILIKTWRIRNVSKSNNEWTKNGLVIKYIGQPFNEMINGAQFDINNENVIKVNDEIECRVMVVSPNNNGVYESEWGIFLNGKQLKTDKKLIVKINVFNDKDGNNGNSSIDESTSVKEMTGETDLNESVISLIDGSNSNDDNKKECKDKIVTTEVSNDDINALADIVSSNDNNENDNDNDIEMKDDIISLAQSMTEASSSSSNGSNDDSFLMVDDNEDTIMTEKEKENEDVNGNAVKDNGSKAAKADETDKAAKAVSSNMKKEEDFIYWKELEILQDMGYSESDEDLLKSLLLTNNGNLDQIVTLLS